MAISGVGETATASVGVEFAGRGMTTASGGVRSVRARLLLSSALART